MLWEVKGKERDDLGGEGNTAVFRYQIVTKPGAQNFSSVPGAELSGVLIAAI